MLYNIEEARGPLERQFTNGSTIPEEAQNMEKEYKVYTAHISEVADFMHILEMHILRRIKQKGEDEMVVWMRNLYQIQVRKLWNRMADAYRRNETILTVSDPEYILIRKIAIWIKDHPLPDDWSLSLKEAG